MAIPRRANNHNLSRSERLYRDAVLPYMDQIEEWSRKHQSEKFMYESLGVSSGSWYSFKSEYPDISKAIAAGRQQMIEVAESKLVELVEGATITEEVWETSWDRKKQKFVEVRTQLKVKKKPPELRAISYYLNNRAAQEWANRNETITRNGATIEEQIANMSDDELERLQAQLFDDEGENET